MTELLRPTPRTTSPLNPPTTAVEKHPRRPPPSSRKNHSDNSKKRVRPFRTPPSLSASQGTVHSKSSHSLPKGRSRRPLIPVRHPQPHVAHLFCCRTSGATSQSEAKAAGLRSPETELLCDTGLFCTWIGYLYGQGCRTPAVVSLVRHLPSATVRCAFALLSLFRNNQHRVCTLWMVESTPLTSATHMPARTAVVKEIRPLLIVLV